MEKIPIVDAHTHISNVVENFAPLYAMADQLGYSQLTVQSLQCRGDLLQNLICAICKAAHPTTTYAFGGLDYLTGRDYRAQSQNLRDMGFDGVKMLEGKPTTRALLGKALDDPGYDAHYEFLEETGFPILFHVGDPPEFWDADKVPDWAKERGWFYDETHVPYAQYYDEVERMLQKHPKLKAIFAHFFFLSGGPARVQKFLDDHPLVSIDITAGIEMYENFSKDPAFWREFFVKNSRRIIFGTDSTDGPKQKDGSGKVDLTGYAGMEINFLRSFEPLEIYGKKLHGLGLPEDAQRRIFAGNFHALVGEKPRALDIDALAKEAEFIRGFIKDAEDMRTLNLILAKLV